MATGARLWPFDGPMRKLTKGLGSLVIVETYPAEALRQLVGKIERPFTKRSPRDRQREASKALGESRDVKATPELKRAIQTGFGPSADGEDQFDAAIGAISLCRWALKGFGHEPAGQAIRTVEGWIAGQKQ